MIRIVSRSVHATLQVFMRGCYRRFVPRWLTSRQTHRHTDSILASLYE